MKTSRLIFICFLAALLTIGITVSAYTMHQALSVPKGTRSIPYIFSVAENPGVDLGTDMFRLGALTPGGSSDRELSIADALSQVVVTDQAVVRVRIVATGRGSEWVSVTPSETDVPATVKVSVHVPEDAKYDTYRGYLLVMPVVVK